MWATLSFSANYLFFLLFRFNIIILPSRTNLLPDSITVVRQTLTLFVLVRIQVRQQRSRLTKVDLDLFLLGWFLLYDVKVF